MVIPFQCTCGGRIKAPDRLQGTPAQCPTCGRVFVVPAPGTAEEAQVEPDQAGTDQGTADVSPEATTSLGLHVPQKEQAERTPVSASVPPPAFQAVTDTLASIVPRQRSISAPSPPPKRKRKARRPKGRKRQLKSSPARNLAAAWKESFAFPFRGDGKWTLFTWTAIYGGIHALLALAPLLFFLSGLSIVALVMMMVLLPTALIFLGYCGFYLLQVLRAAAHGADELPSTNAGDGIAADLFKWVGCLAVGFGPLLGYLVGIAWTGEARNPVVTWACIGFGIFYTPMALLSSVLFETLLGANPLTVFAAMARVPIQYLATCLLIAIIIAAEMLFAVYVPSIPFVKPLLGWFVVLYFSLVVMHLLGTVYYRNRQRIGWFRLE